MIFVFSIRLNDEVVGLDKASRCTAEPSDIKIPLALNK